MVLLTVTPAMRQTLPAPLDLTITHDELLLRYRDLQEVEGSGSRTSLRSLLRGSHVHLEPAPKAQEPTSEYRALMARLRQQEEARQYQKMTDAGNPSDPSTDNATDDEITFADVNRQLALVINVLVSVIACSAALWLVARHWSIPYRLGLSMGGSGLVGAAEVVVYAGYLRRVQESKQRSKKSSETRVVIDSWTVGGKPTQPIPETRITSADNPLRKRIIR